MLTRRGALQALCALSAGGLSLRSLHADPALQGPQPAPPVRSRELWTDLCLLSNFPDDEGNFYPHAWLVREVRRLTPQIGAGLLYGFYPADDRRLAALSHVVRSLDLKWLAAKSYGTLYARVEILDSPAGQRLKQARQLQEHSLACRGYRNHNGLRILSIDAIPTFSPWEKLRCAREETLDI